MRDPNVTAAKLSHQLHVVVPGNAVRGSVRHHAHHEAQDVWRLRSAIDEIAKEHSLAACWVAHAPGHPTVGGGRGAGLDDIPKLLKERTKLLEATVDIADHVEGAVVLTSIVPERL